MINTNLVYPHLVSIVHADSLEHRRTLIGFPISRYRFAPGKYLLDVSFMNTKCDITLHTHLVPFLNSHNCMFANIENACINLFVIRFADVFDLSRRRQSMILYTEV